ncbi:macrolide export ATP-binding/permease protein MacB [gamma proteobacterium NOR5-3]|nr:macrolide export ATP-binding/permease protein MacB [gamma proteobacterium NOR5-3]
MSDGAPIELNDVSYFYGRGSLRKQILFDVSVAVEPGEIVILTGPSGSGKTTLLTLIGALRSAQEGSLKVFGQELRGASERQRIKVRRQIGYIFQSHNLLRSLTIDQNVSMAQRLTARGSRSGKAHRRAVLERVGLGEHINKHPAALSGGQKQRAGIARALVNHPSVILADEPTASLDKHSGRAVVDLLQELAREDGAAVVLVTHDNRILDVADRILHLEDGRMQSSAEAVAESTSRMLNLLGRHAPDSSGYLAAFAFALARVAWADNKVLDSERQAVRQILSEKVGLGPGEVDLVLELSLIQHRAGRRDMASIATEHRKEERDRLFLESLYDIARADNRVAVEEVREIEAIASEFGIGKEVLRDLAQPPDTAEQE